MPSFQPFQPCAIGEEAHVAWPAVDSRLRIVPLPSDGVALTPIKTNAVFFSDLSGSGQQVKGWTAYDLELSITESRLIFEGTEPDQRGADRILAGHFLYEWVFGLTFRRKRGPLAPEEVGIIYQDPDGTSMRMGILLPKTVDSGLLAWQIAERIIRHRLAAQADLSDEDRAFLTSMLAEGQLPPESDRSNAYGFPGCYNVNDEAGDGLSAPPSHLSSGGAQLAQDKAAAPPATSVATSSPAPPAVSDSGAGINVATGTDPDAVAAANPATEPAQLADLAYRRADLRPAIARHPAAYPGLLQWLADLNDPAVTAALRRE